MRISSTGADFIRSEQAGQIQRSSSDDKQTRKVASPTSATVGRSDKVEISESARALAAGTAGVEAPRGDFSPERVALIREKILSGAYNSLEVVDQVARKMLASGDI